MDFLYFVQSVCLTAKRKSLNVQKVSFSSFCYKINVSDTVHVYTNSSSVKCRGHVPSVYTNSSSVKCCGHVPSVYTNSSSVVLWSCAICIQ